MSQIVEGKCLLAGAAANLNAGGELLERMRQNALQTQGRSISLPERRAIASQLKRDRDALITGLEKITWSEVRSKLGYLDTRPDQGWDSPPALGLSDAVLEEVLGPAASTTLAAIDEATLAVGAAISQVGAMAARLTFKEEALSITQGDIQAAYSRIKDAEAARHQVRASRQAILRNWRTALLTHGSLSAQDINFDDK
jgi:flagellin-like hook-associated protein FlgL